MPEREPFTIINGHPVEETWYSNVVRVALYGGDFNSIQAAIDYAVTQTPGPNNGWLVLVYPGVYTEQIVMADYVAVRGVGTREETVITHTCTANNQPTVTGADTTLERFTIVSDGNAGAWAARCVTNATNTFVMKDIRFQTQNSVGAADCINSTHGIWVLDSIVDQAGGVADAIDLSGGISWIDNSEVTGGTNSIHLNTNVATLNVTKCTLLNRILTAGAVAHVLSVAHTDFFGNAAVLGATGASNYLFDHCEGMANVSDASLLGGGSFRECNIAGTGFSVTGTGIWAIYNSFVTSISNTNAAAMVDIEGGIVMSYTRVVGRVVWWQDDMTIKVIPVDTSTDPVINWASVALQFMPGATILVYPGTYNEAGVILSDDVNLVGVDKDGCILDADHCTLITMGANSYVGNLSLDVTSDVTASGFGIECNDNACRIEDVNITLHRSAGAMVVGISEDTGGTAREIHIRNVRVIMSDNTNEWGIRINQAGKTVYIEESFIQGSDYGLGVLAASTVYSFSNLYQATAAASRAVYNDGGTITLREDDILDDATQVVGSGTMVYQDRIGLYHVWPSMSIQNALDALPATGGEVRLQEGTYTVTTSIVMDSYQTLRGSGRNTIITTSVADLDIITATGGAGTEKVGILIADLCIDGNAGGVANDIGILWSYVDYSKIIDVEVRDCGEHGISLATCDYNKFLGNIISNNFWRGISADTCDYNEFNDNLCEDNNGAIWLDACNFNHVSNNTIQGHASSGILIADSFDNTVEDNIVEGGSDDGITVWAASATSGRNIITGNSVRNNASYGIDVYDSESDIIANNEVYESGWAGINLSYCNNTNCEGNNSRKNGQQGIYLDWCTNCVITGNHCLENSQDTDNTYDNIFLEDSDYNLVTGNICRQGALANQPRYGINVSNAGCNKNIVQGNDLHDSGNTANFNDAGTLTIVEDDNREITQDQVRRYVYAKNTSGAQRVAGEVVVVKSVAAGNEFTTTTTLGDAHVQGMVAETIANDAWGYVLVAGKTTVLSGSNDNGNIAIGDFLCASDTATEAVLATAGTTAFAIALEALAASGPTPLDALLINPLTF